MLLVTKVSDSDVGSSYPGGEEAPKGRAVRPLKGYASWVQNVVRQFGLYPVQAMDTWGELLLVREDCEGGIPGVPVVSTLWGSKLDSYIPTG